MLMMKKSEFPRPQGDHLLDRRQLAVVLSVSEKTVQRWRELGKLPPPVQEMLPLVRWRWSDVQKWFGLQ